METSVCRISAAPDSAPNSDDQPAFSPTVNKVQSQTTSSDLLSDSPPVNCSSFIAASLPCSNKELKINGDFVDQTDLEFSARSTNSPKSLLQNTVTSLSSKLHQAARSSSYLSLQTLTESSDNFENSEDIYQQNSTNKSEDTCSQMKSSQAEPDPLDLNKIYESSSLNNFSQTSENLKKLSINLSLDISNQTEAENDIVKIEPKVNESFLSDQGQSGLEDEDFSEECSSSGEDETNSFNNKRIRSPQSSYLSCKKRRKQSNPIKCGLDVDDSNKASLNNLSQAETFNSICEKITEKHNSINNEEDDLEEGLVKKHINSLSGVASAAAKFFLSNHQSQNINESSLEPQLNYSFYLAAAAAVATNAASKGTKHRLHYCRECCCPFLSSEHEKLYRQLEQNDTSNQINEKSVFAQQLQSIVQQSKLLQELESVFGSNYELGQLPQRNAIDAMQLIKQLESGQLDSEETKHYQNQLLSLMNTNLLSSSNNQVVNPLSALLAGRIFNPDAYCELCNKEFCNKYFLKTHRANKHGIQETQNSMDSSSKCLSPTNTSQLIDEFTGLIRSTGSIINPEAYCEICRKEFCNKYFLKKHKQKVHSDSGESSSQKSPVSLSPKRDQLQYDLTNSFANTSSETNEESTNQNGEQKENVIRSQTLALQQMLNNANQLQQISAVMQAESFANILRNSLVQPNSNDTTSADLAHLLNSAATNFLFTPERLREMGVINPEAFCDICCKEFCNKYFLKTHKANKHGIQMDDECSRSSCDSQNHSHLNSNNKLNEQINKENSKKLVCNLDDDALEPGQRDPSTINPMDLTTLLMLSNINQSNLINNNDQTNASLDKNSDKNFILNNLSNKGNNNEAKIVKNQKCELCSKTFCSNYLLKMHRFYSHQIPFAKEDDLGKDDSNSNVLSENKKNETLDRNNNSNDDMKNNSSRDASTKETKNDQINSSYLSQAATLEQQQNDEILKFQQMIKEIQQNSENDLETELFKKFALLHKQQLVPKQSNEETSIICDLCEKEFKNRNAYRSHNCPANTENRLTDSPNSIFSNLSVQMASTMLNNSNNSTLNCTGNNESDSLVNQTNNNNLNLSSNGRESLSNGNNNLSASVNNSLLNNVNSSSSNHNPQHANNNQNRMSPVNLGQNNPLLANLTQTLPQNLPTDVTNSIFFSSTAGITLDPNNKQPKFVAGRNYCNLCNKELCNKYFMKTHMMKMHNINIDEHPAEAAANSIVGGVMCDICQKELCSKYFLKVHKQNTHGIYEDGAVPVTNSTPTVSSSSMMTSNSIVNNVPTSTSLGTNQTNLVSNCMANSNNLNTSNSANSLNPLLNNVYDTENLSKEHQQQLQQLQLQLTKQTQIQQQQILAMKNGSVHNQTNQQNNNQNSNLTSNQQQNSPSSNENRLSERSEKELFYLQGIDPNDTTNRYFNQYTEVCPYCKRRFKSIKWMKTHVFNEHQNLISSKTNSIKQQILSDSLSSDKMRCIFCTKLFSDSISLHLHMVNDHRSSLEEMILASNMELASNFGADNSFGKRKLEKDVEEKKKNFEENYFQKKSVANDTYNDEKPFFGEPLSYVNKKVDLSSDKTNEENNTELKDNKTLDSDIQSLSEDEQLELDVDDNSKNEKQNQNIVKILNSIQKIQLKKLNNNFNSTDSDDQDEEEQIIEEDKLASILNNGSKIQQLLMSNAASSQQPINDFNILNNAKLLSLCDELLSQQQASNSTDQKNLNEFNSDSSNQVHLDELESSEYERFNNVVQHQQLLQQIQLVQQKDQTNKTGLNSTLNKKRNSNMITKLHQCNYCEYNTRWLSNLYAHEKRRHNTCSSSSGNPNALTLNGANNSTNRTSTHSNLNNLINSIESSNSSNNFSLALLNSSKITSQFHENLNDPEIMNHLNDLSSNQNINSNFVNLLSSSQTNNPLSINESKPLRPVKERAAGGDGQFVCNICQRSYRHKHSLHRHLVCHRNREHSDSSCNKINNQNNDSNKNISPSPSNEINKTISSTCSSAENVNSINQSNNRTSTPSFFSTGRSSSVDSINSGENVNQKNNQLTNQMFNGLINNGLNQEMLESFISGSNSSILGSLITNNSNNSKNTNVAFKSSSENSSTTTPNTTTSAAAMFLV